MSSCFIYLSRPVGSVVVHIAFGAGGLGIDSQSNQTQCRQRLATAPTFLRSCVTQAISHGDGPLHSLHASVLSLEDNEDLIFDLLHLLHSRSVYDPQYFCSALGTKTKFDSGD